MPKDFLPLLSSAAAATSPDAFVEALLGAWQKVVRADYYSLISFSHLTKVVTYWHPGEGRLPPDHWLPRLFAELLADEKELETHPSTVAFLRHGPGAYIRSALEPDQIWRQRGHYRLVDSKQGINDMVSLFLTPAHGHMITLHAGTKGAPLDHAVAAPARDFGTIASALLAARDNFSPAGPDPELSVREREILGWVGEGKRNAEIAAILGISAHTVRNHLVNIFAKLGVETRTAAATTLRDNFAK